MKNLKRVLTVLIVNAMIFANAFIMPTSVYAANIDTLEAGDMVLDKTAEPVPGQLNTWKVTVKVTARDFIKPKDYIIVVDQSTSMLYNKDNKKPQDVPGYNKGDEMTDSRIVYARDAAKQFVGDIYESNAENRVAVLSYASAPTSDVVKTTGVYKDGAEHSTLQIGLTESQQKQDVLDSIDRIEASGGTYTQLALHQAAEVMEEAKKADTLNQRERVIILNTDGVPTVACDVDWSKVPADSKPQATKVKTGDNVSIMVWFVAGLISLVSIVLIAVKKS